MPGSARHFFTLAMLNRQLLFDRRYLKKICGPNGTQGRGFDLEFEAFEVFFHIGAFYIAV